MIMTFGNSLSKPISDSYEIYLQSYYSGTIINIERPQQKVVFYFLHERSTKLNVHWLTANTKMDYSSKSGRM